ncbi:hypothetical protein A0U40_03375 [[Bacillus] sp. KCTC 13219]|nr:hypothetical protein A0U40_03375 [[Bacillus] sp. KCTC 13219]
MKIVILAEKPSQAKAYAEAFEVASREGTHITLKPGNTFHEGADEVRKDFANLQSNEKEFLLLV